MTAPQKPLTLSSLAGLILLPGVLILAACGTGPDVETFTIRANYPGPVPGTEILPVTLQVKPLSAPTLYGDQRFIWRSSAETRALKTMDKRLWSEAPPRLIQTEIMRCLSASKVVESVIPADVQVDFDYALSGEVRELLVETQGERHQAIVAFDVFVTQRRPRRLLWSGSYRHREDTGDQTAQGFVNAVERTLETLCVQMTTDLRSALKVQEQSSAASSTVRSTSRPDRGTSPPT